MKRLLFLLLAVGSACGSPDFSVISVEEAIRALQVRPKKIIYVFGGPSFGYQKTLSQAQLKKLSRKLSGKLKKKRKKKKKS